MTYSILPLELPNFMIPRPSNCSLQRSKICFISIPKVVHMTTTRFSKTNTPLYSKFSQLILCMSHSSIQRRLQTTHFSCVILIAQFALYDFYILVGRLQMLNTTVNLYSSNMTKQHSVSSLSQLHVWVLITNIFLPCSTTVHFALRTHFPLSTHTSATTLNYTLPANCVFTSYSNSYLRIAKAVQHDTKLHHNPP